MKKLLLTVIFSASCLGAAFSQNVIRGNGYEIRNYSGFLHLTGTDQYNAAICDKQHVPGIEIRTFSQDTFNIVNRSSGSVLMSFQGMFMIDNNFFRHYNNLSVVNSKTSGKLFELNQGLMPPMPYSKIRFGGSQIKNDTLWICRKEDFISDYCFEIYEDDNATSPICSQTYSENLAPVFLINGEKKNYQRLSNIALNDGDKIQAIIYKAFKPVNFFGDMCSCLEESFTDSILTQTITLKYKKNEILPKPVLTNPEGICPGDTAVLTRDPTLKKVTWQGVSYDSSLQIRSLYVPLSPYFLRSTQPKSNGCYAVSDTVWLKRKNCGFTLIRGIMYEDVNNNYRYDQNEPVFPNKKVRINIGPAQTEAYAFSDQYGIFQFKTDTITRATFSNPIKIIDPDMFSITGTSFDIKPLEYMGLFLITHRLASSDLGLRSGSGRFRPGFTVPIYYNITNLGKLTNAGTLSVTLDKALTFAKASQAPASVDGKIVTFNLDSIYSGDTKTITLYATVFPGTPLNDSLIIKASLSPARPEINLLNNSLTDATIVTGSWDPNDIAVTPQGIGPEGLVRDTTGLEYLIRFQNMGNDTAFNIIVKSRIPLGLDFSTFSTISTSHPCSVGLDGDSIVWTFSDILLPAKITNEPASHGLIKFRMKQKQGNPYNTEIRNKAFIYFDYNSAVVTNEVLNTVWDGVIAGIGTSSQNTSLSLFPNPSQGNIHLSSEAEGILKITDSMGRIVFQQTHQGKLIINLSMYPKGVYYYSNSSRNNHCSGKILLE